MIKSLSIALIIFALTSCTFENAEIKVSKLLDTQKEVSIDNAIKAHNIIIATKTFNKDLASKLEILLASYLENVAIKTTDDLNKLLETNASYQVFTDSFNTVADLYKHYGLDVYMSEGYVTIDVSPTYIVETFSKYKSEIEKQLAALHQIEMEIPSTMDARITIPYEDICSRLSMCDDLISKCDNEKFKEEISNYQRLYISLLITGLDNTPSFDWDTQELRPEIRKAINDYTKQYPKSQSSATLRQFISTIENNNYKENSESVSFVSDFLNSQE